MVLIKSLEDFELFKEFPVQPICYVYYKDSLALNAHYVGFTTQHGYKYLKRHHKMKKIEDVLNEGYFIQIYTKYNENSLIKFFKPTLNQIAGSGICGRVMGRGNLRSVGVLFRRSKRFRTSNFYRPVMRPYIFSLPINLVFIIIEEIKHKLGKESIVCHNETILQLKNKKITIPMLMNLFQILKYCKIHCLYDSYVIIHQVYLENLLNHVQMHPQWIEVFKHSKNYQYIHDVIVSRLKENHYLTNSILDYKNYSFELNKGPSYYYRHALLKVINE
jgi:hypothetical protein